MAAGHFYRNTATGATFEWAPELENHAKGRKEFVLVDADGVEVKPTQQLKSYKELAKLREEAEAARLNDPDAVPDITDSADGADVPAPVPSRTGRKHKE